jgi:hypothetical protein
LVVGLAPVVFDVAVALEAADVRDALSVLPAGPVAAFVRFAAVLLDLVLALVRLVVVLPFAAGAVVVVFFVDVFAEVLVGVVAEVFTPVLLLLLVAAAALVGGLLVALVVVDVFAVDLATAGVAVASWVTAMGAPLVTAAATAMGTFPSLLDSEASAASDPLASPAESDAVVGTGSSSISGWLDRPLIQSMIPENRPEARVRSTTPIGRALRSSSVCTAAST